MLQYGDELEIKEYVKNKQLSEINIYDEIIVDGAPYSFKRTNLMNDNLSMILPYQFCMMSEEHAECKYPSKFRPEIILTDDSGSVNITFSKLSDDKNKSIKEKTTFFQHASKRFSPSAVFLDKKVIQIPHNKEVGYYDYRGFTFSEDIYILKFITTINGDLVLGGFNCIWGKHLIWSILIKQMLTSICDLTEIKEVDLIESDSD